MKPFAGVRLGPVALQILTYLSTHQDAQDTAEGIAEWWLLEQRIRHVISEVKQALAELVAHGLVLERRGRDQRVRYSLNARQRKAAAQHLRLMSPEATPTPPTDPAGSRSGNSRGRR